MKRILLLSALVISMLLLFTGCGCEHEEWGYWTTTKGATCTAAGERVRSCKECGEEEYESIPMTSHSWQAATCTSPKKCRNCWTTTGTALGHKTNTLNYCNRCEKFLTTSPVLGRKYSYACITSTSSFAERNYNIYIELKENNTYVVSFLSTAYTGTWKYSSADSDKMILEAYNDSGKIIGELWCSFTTKGNISFISNTILLFCGETL